MSDEIVCPRCEWTTEGDEDHTHDCHKVKSNCIQSLRMIIRHLRVDLAKAQRQRYGVEQVTLPKDTNTVPSKKTNGFLFPKK